MRVVLLMACGLLFYANGMAATAPHSPVAVFAGGCFWCMESEFAEIPGVSKVVSGFTGGHVANPTYEQVSAGDTGHVESIEVTYDPTQVTYQHLLDIFWENVDPLDATGQFCDQGTQYRAGIFYQDEEQKKLAEASLDRVKKRFNTPVFAFVRQATIFYPAEDYHQKYYLTNRDHYLQYREGCGRDQRLQELWQEPPVPTQKSSVHAMR